MFTCGCTSPRNKFARNGGECPQPATQQNYCSLIRFACDSSDSSCPLCVTLVCVFRSGSLVSAKPVKVDSMAKLGRGLSWSGTKKVTYCFATAAGSSVGASEFCAYFEEKERGCVSKLPGNFEAIVLKPGQNQYFEHVTAQGQAANGSHYLICFSRA